MQHTQIARLLFLSDCLSACRLRSAGEDRERPEAASKRLGRTSSKHAADFTYYHPNTISHKAITMPEVYENVFVEESVAPVIVLIFNILKNRSADCECVRYACGWVSVKALFFPPQSSLN